MKFTPGAAYWFIGSFDKSKRFIAIASRRRGDSLIFAQPSDPFIGKIEDVDGREIAKVNGSDDVYVASSACEVDLEAAAVLNRGK